ncbi:MAG: serine/threonine protein kinase [Deltaproteobacteria bacterium]|nr:serine/threonine protein kinase [Deltaproteobacteria bacterium]
MSDPGSAATVDAPDPLRVRALVDAARARAPEERDAFIDGACDALVAREVRAMLAFADGATAADTATRPGGAAPATIGRFQILGKLGEGGMGIVYRGYDGSLDREVALKLVRGDGRDGRARLLREAHAMARVAHPNVMPVYEVGVHADGIFVAMELVRGPTLGAWLRAAPRTWRAIVKVLVEAGRGLAAAHRAGVLHRDFKPDNVLVGDDGRARVLDFGLARATDAPDDEARDGDDDRLLARELTRHGAVVGTPGFMSPEHFAGTLTPLADQWSFAVTAYYALFGALPFPADDLAQHREAVRTLAPVVPTAGEVPVAILDAILRGLQRLPEDRFPSLDALLDRLETLAAPDDERARFRRQRRALAVVVGCLGVATLFIGGLRTDFRYNLTTREVLVQGLLGLGALAIGTLVFRRAVFRTAYDRNVLALLAIVVASISVHRAIMLDAEVRAVLRTDAVFVLALLVLGAITIERWFAISALSVASYLVLSFAIPAITVPGFPVLLLGTLGLGIWFWREPTLPARLATSRPPTPPAPTRRLRP